jgi:hypothetical protein
VSTDSWYILDAIGPFFLGYARRRVNWSKIPFAHLERDGVIDAERWPEVRAAFIRLCDRAVGIGYNTISLDDVAHLADSPRYPASTRRLIGSYRTHFAELFDLAAARGLRVLLTTDVMFVHRDAPLVAGASADEQIRFLAELLDALFASFPAVSGIIVRVGESDGLDVEDAFLSRLTIRTPGQCRSLLTQLLAVCERHDRTLIFRTWTVGAHRIGDLIWNRTTYHRVFAGIDSPRLIISMKFGETDFFRYLPLNPQFSQGAHRKLIELQARREYEGCGEYPSYVGHDYQRYRDELQARGVPLAGIMVWCQTGGWTVFRRLTFIDDPSPWNAINTHAALRLFRDGLSADEAVEDWCEGAGLQGVAHSVKALLRLSSEAICEGLYIDDFARQKLFFRRLRVPPLLWVFWDQILIMNALARVFDCFVADGPRQLARSESALRKIATMRVLARRSGLPEEDLVFMEDTFRILAAARQYFIHPATRGLQERIHRLVHAYEERHPNHYSVRVDLRPPPLNRIWLKRLIRLLLRQQRGYRWLDQLITLRLLAWAYPMLRWFRLVPALAERRAMGIETVFR